MKITDHTGKTFSRLKVLRRLSIKPATYECQCECGNLIAVASCALVGNKTKSCGCWKRDQTIKRNIANAKHGHYGSPTYGSWKSMRARCYNSKHTHYANYGGRGITVCERWRFSFSNFLADMGERPHGNTINRIDNTKGYEPGNCEWATNSKQSRNRRNNRRIQIDDDIYTLAELAEILHMNKNTLHAALSRAKAPLWKG